MGGGHEVRVPPRVPWWLWVQVAVEGFLRRECSALPVPTMVTPCQNLVHEYLALLVTHLEQHLVSGTHGCCEGRAGEPEGAGGGTRCHLGTLWGVG